MAKTIDLMMSLKDGVSPKLSNISNNLGTLNGKIKASQKSVLSFGNAMKTAFITGTIASFVGNAMKAYDTQILAEKSLERSIRATGTTADKAKAELSEWKDFASQQQNLTAFGDESTLAVISDLVGQGFGKKSIKDIVAMSQDLARATGDTQENVTKALSAYIKTGKGATKLAKAYKLNADLLGKGATESERQAEVWKALSESGAIGASADYMKTFSGQLEAIQGRLGDLNEPLGELFQTLLGFDKEGNFAKQLDDSIVDATNHIQELTNNAKEYGGGVTGVMIATAEAHPVIMSLLTAMTASKVIGGLATLAENMKSVGTAIEVVGGIATSTGGIVVGFIGTLVASIYQMKKWVEQSQEVRNELDAQNALSYGVDVKGERDYWKSRGVNLDLSGASANQSPSPNATGTKYFGGGLAEVGEHGGEILNLPNGTQIIPNDISKKMTGGYTVNCPVTIQGNVIGNEDFINQIGNAITSKVQLAISNC